MLSSSLLLESWLLTWRKLATGLLLGVYCPLLAVKAACTLECAAVRLCPPVEDFFTNKGLSTGGRLTKGTMGVLSSESVHWVEASRVSAVSTSTVWVSASWVLTWDLLHLQSSVFRSWTTVEGDANVEQTVFSVTPSPVPRPDTESVEGVSFSLCGETWLLASA